MHERIKPWPWLVAGLLVSAFAVEVAGLLRDASRGYGLLHSDDAYYYLLAARNAVEGGFFSVDGQNVTNGFHPLWALILAGYFALAGTAGSLVSQIFAVSTLEAAVRAAAFAGCLVVALCNRPVLAGGFWGIALLLALPWLHLFEMGMEASLAVLCLAATLWALLAGRVALFSLFAAALLLARLDTLVFVIPWLLLALGAMQGWRRALQAAIAPVVAFVVYSAVNLATLGHVKPISGALKSSFPVPRPSLLQWQEQWQMLEWNGWLYMLVQPNMLLVLGLLGMGAAAAAWARPSRREVLCLAAMGAGCLSLLLNFLLFQKWSKSIEPWYYALPLACACFVFASGVFLASARLKPVLAHGLVAVLAALCLWQALAHFPPARERDFTGLPAFAPIIEHTRPGDLLASTDSGALAFWTRRRVVNLDGLVNNYPYQERLAQGQLDAYLREQGVRYIALAHWTRPGQRTNQLEAMYAHRFFPQGARTPDYVHYDFWVHSYLYGRDSDRIRFTPRDEAVRVNLGEHAGAQASYVLYRFPPAGP